MNFNLIYFPLSLLAIYVEKLGIRGETLGLSVEIVKYLSSVVSVCVCVGGSVGVCVCKKRGMCVYVLNVGI